MSYLAAEVRAGRAINRSPLATHTVEGLHVMDVDVDGDLGTDAKPMPTPSVAILCERSPAPANAVASPPALTTIPSTAVSSTATAPPITSLLTLEHVAVDNSTPSTAAAPKSPPATPCLIATRLALQLANPSPRLNRIAQNRPLGALEAASDMPDKLMPRPVYKIVLRPRAEAESRVAISQSSGLDAASVIPIIPQHNGDTLEAPSDIPNRPAPRPSYKDALKQRAEAELRVAVSQSSGLDAASVIPIIPQRNDNTLEAPSDVPNGPVPRPSYKGALKQRAEAESRAAVSQSSGAASVIPIIPQHTGNTTSHMVFPPTTRFTGANAQVVSNTPEGPSITAGRPRRSIHMTEAAQQLALEKEDKAVTAAAAAAKRAKRAAKAAVAPTKKKQGLPKKSAKSTT